MLVSILALLVVADIFLIVSFLRLQRRQLASQEIVRELTEERSMLSDLRGQIRDELMAAQTQVRSLKDQVQVLATEAEQEVRHGLADITREVDSIIANISQKLDAPMQALAEKQHFITQLARDAKKERELLTRLVQRSENVARLLEAGSSWEDIVDQIQAKRYEDIRAMLAKGLQPERIARELGVTEQEVRIVSGAL